MTGREPSDPDSRTLVREGSATLPGAGPALGRGGVLPERLGPYRIESELGIGGMGEVYRAYDELLARPVALKLIRPELLQAGEPDHVARYRFRHEARAAARLNHPNIVQIFHILETDLGDAIVMEMVEGRGLSSLLKEGKPTYEEVIGWGRQVALGLAEAHAKGIVHRDLKASNVMITEQGRVKILDFGLAKVWQEEPQKDEVVTGIGQVVGSYDSMSPEQAKGYEVGPRSDLFSLGILFFYMTTGHKPFVADTAMATLTRICTEPHPPVRDAAPDVPEELASLIDLLLAKKPADRPSSARRVVSMLSAMGGAGLHPPAARPAGRTSAGRTSAGRTSSSPSGTPLLRAVVLFDGRAPDAGARERELPRLIVELLERHDGVCPDLDPEGALPEPPLTAVFEHPQQAVQFALAYMEEIFDAGGRFQGRAVIHFGALGGAGGSSFSAVDEPGHRLFSLALADQILLTRGAFDLARGYLEITRREADESAGGPALRWLAHGEYLLPSGTVVELFEVGREGRAPLRPPSSDVGRRLESSSGRRQVLGWRPAVGQETPGRPRWQLEAKLGEGGFGEVWLVRHRSTGERRVLKFCFEPDRLRALQREIALFRLLKETLGERADIAKVLDWNFEQPPFFIESEYTEGGDLETWASARGGIAEIPLSTRLEIVAQVADALAAAHSVGVLHKDVKPTNILMSVDTDGGPRARLADFGIGALDDPRRFEESSITHLGLLDPDEGGGTPLYTAPEIFTGRSATVQADVYALGVVLYQVVVGDLGRALGPGRLEEVEDPLLREDVAAAVDGRPERRLRSAAELSDRLRRLEERRQEAAARRREAEEAEELEASARRAHGRRHTGLAALVVLVVLGGLAAGQTTRLVEERARANREAAIAGAAADFLVELFGSSDPLSVSGETVTGEVSVGQILDRGTERIHEELAGRPRVQARLLVTLGRVYGNLGLFDEAGSCLAAARRLYDEIPGADPARVAELYWAAAEVYERAGDLDRAREEARLALHYRGRSEPASGLGAERAREEQDRLLDRLGLAGSAPSGEAR